MKIVVAHPGTQHVKHLLKALWENGLLVHFFTSFVFTKIRLPLYLIPSRIAKVLTRYNIDYLPLEVITHYPWLFIRYKFLKSPDSTKKNNIKFENKVLRSILKLDFDVVIGYESTTLILFKQSKELGKISVLDMAAVHHSHQIDLYNEYPSYRALYTSREDFEALCKRKSEAFLYTDYVFCLSNYAKETLIKGGINPDRVFITSLGINHENFKPKRDYPSENNNLKILFVGRISHLKGLEILLKALDDLDENIFKCKLIGPKDDFDLNPYSERISYTPFLSHSDLVKEYQEADVFVTCSYTDSWAQTVLEAMACGTPVIVSENTGAKDAVLEGGGFVIPVNDEQALKEKIQYFYNHRSEVERMGRVAHRIAQQYTWGNYHQQVLNALTEIAHRENLA